MWRVPAMPIGGHTLLSFLAEPLKQPTETLLSTEDHDVSENLREFQDWSEYYSCDATYCNWLKVELENVEVSSLELSVEEKQRAIAAAKETLNSSFSLLFRKENPWLVPAEDHVYESVEPLFLELHAIAMLCLPSGECMCPDAALCATLMSALYSSVNEEVVLNRQLMVSVSISSTDNYCIEVVLRCLATDGDGLGPHELNDGGILATVIAAGFKGELVQFQADVTMEISRLDAWYSSKDGSLEGPATYIVWGLCRRCCIPEVILRCMQVSVSLVESGNPPKSHDELIELVASPKTGFSIYLVSNNCK
ncbi:Nuclear pore complex protein NUP107 [Camellia lanceoleosa]|uniref:Nuclear pore complex protein NUP107 n=1 Tax=Camellia lanceoleosa TaxID=1840588 RepID=A0ACC0ILY9_9ERIC|nr:Nuclear pore complex protein NUP107 [Camellia lanceoleosa]